MYKFLQKAFMNKLLEHIRYYYSVEDIAKMKARGMTLEDIADAYDNWQQELIQDGGDYEIN